MELDEEFMVKIAPNMEHGWIAMDKGPWVNWRWYIRRPLPDLEKGVWVTDMSCGKCSLKNFRINFNGDWTESLREVGNENN